MKTDDRCLPYAEEMKTCGYCAEGEYLAAFGIKICELDATKLYLFKEQSHRGRVIVASKLHVSEITALSDEERNAFFADVNRVAKALHAVFNPTKVNYGAYGDTGHHLQAEVSFRLGVRRACREDQVRFVNAVDAAAGRIGGALHSARRVRRGLEG